MNGGPGRGVRTLFVGLGSPHADDQVGWLVSDVLARRAEPTLTVRKAGSAADLLDWLGDCDRLLVCDGCRGMGRPGEVFRWPLEELPRGSLRHGGSHALDLTAILALAGELGRLPAMIEVIGIEIANCEPGALLSPDVAAAVGDALALFGLIESELPLP